MATLGACRLLACCGKESALRSSLPGQASQAVSTKKLSYLFFSFWCESINQSFKQAMHNNSTHSLVTVCELMSQCHLSGYLRSLPNNVPRCQALSADWLCHIKWRDTIFLFRYDFHRLFASVFWPTVNICGRSAILCGRR